MLLIRGELLHRYPDALIYAVRAKTTKALGTEEKLPLFRGRIDPDITFLGFDLTEAEARGTTTDPGWFFVIQEQPTAPRFGLDEMRTGPLDTWNDLAWSDVGTAPGANVAVLATTADGREPGRRRLGVQRGAHGRRAAAAARADRDPRAAAPLGSTAAMKTLAQVETLVGALPAVVAADRAPAGAGADALRHPRRQAAAARARVPGRAPPRRARAAPVGGRGRVGEEGVAARLAGERATRRPSASRGRSSRSASARGGRSGSRGSSGRRT